MRKLLLIVCVLSILNLAGCSAPIPDGKVCTASVPIARAIEDRDAVLKAPKLTPLAAQLALSLYARRCIQRWGYRLAASSEPLDVVSRAVAAACDREIDFTTDLTVQISAECPDCEPVERLKLMMVEQAHLAILQARLGDCRSADNADEEQRKPTPDRPIAFR